MLFMWTHHITAVSYLFFFFRIEYESLLVNQSSALNITFVNTAGTSGDVLYAGSVEDQTFQRLSVQLSASDPIELQLDTVTVGLGFIKGESCRDW